jgi:hypothetical protein
MGISAAGYIGGKAVRQPGPNIGRAEALSKSTALPPIANPGPYLVVYGDHLSNGNKKVDGGSFVPNDKVADMGATIQIASSTAPTSPIILPKEKVATQDFDPDNPSLFARTLKIDLSDTGVNIDLIGAAPSGSLLSLTDFWKQYTLTIVNADGQRADYKGPLTAAPSQPA